MGEFTDMWETELLPKATNLNDNIEDILHYSNVTIRCLSELKIRLGEEELKIFDEYVNANLIVRECYKYNAFKQGFIEGKNFAKEIENFEKITELQRIDERITNLKGKKEAAK